MQEMFNFPAIFIANGTAILLLFIILFSSKRPLRHGFLDEKMYYMMVILNILQCLVESIVFILDGKTGYGFHALLMVLNTSLFINNIIFAFSWTIYVDYKLFADIERIKQKYPFVAIPAVLIIIGCLINFVTPVFFVVDKYNVYQRTVLYLIPYVCTYFYLAYGVVLIYSYRSKVYQYLSLPAILFMVPIIIGSMLQFFFYGYSLVWLGVSIGMISLFINVQNEASYVDVLSGLFNRQYLNNMLLMYSKKRDTAGVPAGIMLDIDGFKSVNDRFGHLVGDDAIATAGNLLHTSVGDQGVVCRYGGDEFIILMYIHSQKEIMDMIDTIKTQVTLFNESEKKPYKIEFSIGYSTFERQHESVDDFLKKLDASMYEDKNRKIDGGMIPDRRRNR
ncbi:MAG: GGDEF domain-containing protein [Saccharofermentanales bacterium]|jgi:diguanylate cyclase (GGDEF)-like protein|nr:GGDEF domain-containing protein [Bacillota bacterium]